MSAGKFGNTNCTRGQVAPKFEIDKSKNCH